MAGFRLKNSAIITATNRHCSRPIKHQDNLNRGLQGHNYVPIEWPIEYEEIELQQPLRLLNM
jgi:hypothetical protein